MAQFFIKRPIFACVIALIILLGGTLTVLDMPVAQYPNIAPPSVRVTATYPGASAQIVEETVTSVVEQEMNGIEGLLSVNSDSSSNGTANITIAFRPGTDFDIAQVEVNNRVKRVESRLPEPVRRQGLRVDKATRNFMMILTISSNDGSMDSIALGNYANNYLLDELRRVQGVGEAQVFGTEYAMRIWLDPIRLTAFALTPSDVAAAIQSQNIQVAAGELGALPANVGQMLNATVVTDSRLNTVEEFEQILLKVNPSGSRVLLKDVARVELGGESYASSAYVNGQPAAAMAVKLSPTGNAVETSALIKERMAQLAPFFPPGTKWDIPYDTTDFVRISIREVVQTLFEAVLLVFLVMFLFLQNWRATLIPTLVVPVAVMGAFIGMGLFGFSINVLTLFGLVLAIGILVDDAIVVVENVERIMREEGLSPREATAKAMGQITGAIVGITLVLVAVFIPMAFFSGSVGAIYRQFSGSCNGLLCPFHISLDFYIMFLFAQAGVIQATGVANVLAQKLVAVVGDHPRLLAGTVLFSSGIFSSGLDNVVAVASYVPVVQSLDILHFNLKPLWWALLFGACYGGNITMIGSTANIVALSLLEKEQNVKISFSEWLKIGLIIGVLSMLIAYLAVVTIPVYLK